MKVIEAIETFDGERHDNEQEALNYLRRLESDTNTKLAHLLMDHTYKSAVDVVDRRLDELAGLVNEALAIRNDIEEVNNLF